MMNREILRLAIPNIISNISVPLLSSVDTALMGRMSEWHIGAVGIGSMIFNFIYWNFGFLRMGTTGLTAQAYGRGDDTDKALTLGRALMVAWLLALIVLVFQRPLVEASVYLMNSSGEQAELIRKYFYIRIWAAPATLASYAIFGWLFGMQNAIYPLILTILINAVNIGANFYFVYEWEMDVDGVAWGTVIAQYVGLLAGFILLFLKYRSLFRNLKMRAILAVNQLKRFLTLNADIFIRTLCLTFAFGFFYSQSSATGSLVLAVNVILLQFLNWMSYGVDGFAFAAESLVGKYYGARENKETQKAIRLSFAWGMGLAVIFSLVYTLGGNFLLRIFTNQQDVIVAAQPFLFWMGILPIIGTPSYIWDGIYVGLTASKAMRNSMLLSLVVYLASYFSLEQYFPAHGLWVALLLFLAARGVFQWWLYKRSGGALN